MLEDVTSVLKEDPSLLRSSETVQELNLLYELAGGDYLGNEVVILELLEYWGKAL